MFGEEKSKMSGGNCCKSLNRSHRLKQEVTKTVRWTWGSPGTPRDSLSDFVVVANNQKGARSHRFSDSGCLWGNMMPAGPFVRWCLARRASACLTELLRLWNPRMSRPAKANLNTKHSGINIPTSVISANLSCVRRLTCSIRWVHLRDLFHPPGLAWCSGCHHRYPKSITVRGSVFLIIIIFSINQDIDKHARPGGGVVVSDMLAGKRTYVQQVTHGFFKCSEKVPESSLHKMMH